MLGLFTTLQNIETMRKLYQFLFKMFVSQIFIWKFYTIKEFFQRGGYIFTLKPGCQDGTNLGNYCKYLSYEAFVKDWPYNHWLRGQYSEYVIYGVKAEYESVPEHGFVCRIPKNVPNYPNAALAIIVSGIVIVACSLFCLSAIVGFTFIGAVVTCIGALLYRQSIRSPKEK